MFCWGQRDLLLCLPCLVIGVLWSWVSRRYQHFSVLPMSMLAVPAIFFVVLSLSGQSMQVRWENNTSMLGLSLMLIAGAAVDLDAGADSDVNVDAAVGLDADADALPAKCGVRFWLVLG